MTLPYFRPNTIYCGDCKEVLRKFPNECVDLIYADPPFFSNRHYEVIWGNGYEIGAFEDRWKGGINHYVAWMVERLNECYRVLKKTGSMYLHCDWHASHYLKVEMDRLFGEGNFINQIIWKRHTVHSDTKQGARHLGRIHDSLLLHAKSDNYTWVPQYQPYSQEYLATTYRHVDKDGRRYKASDLTAAKPGGDTYHEWKGKHPSKGRYWAYSKENLEKLEKEGRIHYSRAGYPYLKHYLDEMPGIVLQDIWDDIKPVSGRERLGYPTQKPQALVERIIKLSSNPTDIVLDPFCGGGTTIVVAHRLGRRWIGIDVSPTACNKMEKSIRSAGAKDFAVLGMPMSQDDLRKLQPFEFQNWVVQRLFGRVSDRKSSDMGIDGYTFEGHPVQVKQSDDVGRNVVDNFETAMRRRGSSKGVIVAFSFGKGAHEEAARAKLHDGLEIELVTIADLVKNRRNNDRNRPLQMSGQKML